MSLQYFDQTVLMHHQTTRYSKFGTGPLVLSFLVWTQEKKNEAFLPQDFSEQGNSPAPSSCGQNVWGPDYFVFTS